MRLSKLRAGSQIRNPNSEIEKARRALPFAAGFPVSRLLTLLPGRPKLFHQIDVGSPPALSPSLAGSQRIGGREAADPLTSGKPQFVADVESTKSGSLSAGRFFISSRRSFSRRNFKRLNFARVAFAARNCCFQLVNVPISGLLNSAAAAKVQLQWRGREVVWQRPCQQWAPDYFRPKSCY